MRRFEWDSRKNLGNASKHDVYFEEAQTVWADPTSVEYYDPEHSQTEDRFLRIGYSSRERLLVIAFCERQSSAIRLISAREATPNERRQHEEGI